MYFCFIFVFIYYFIYKIMKNYFIYEYPIFILRSSLPLFNIIYKIMMIMIIIDALAQITYRSESGQLLNCLEMI